MPLRPENTRITFRKLSRQLSKLAGKLSPENVHKFRTSSRRVEVLVSDLSERRSGNDKKLLKLLARLRKKAGRVRDLDVQSAALRSLKIPEQPVRKARLMRTLAEERSQREKRLTKSLDKKTVAEVRKRLKRAAASLELPKNADPLALARQKLNALEVDQGAITEKTLHQFRIAGKRARYIAELAGKDAEASRLIGLLNHMQDVIGDWHDWVQLAERAEEAVWRGSGIPTGGGAAQRDPRQVPPGRKHSDRNPSRSGPEESQLRSHPPAAIPRTRQPKFLCGADPHKICQSNCHRTSSNKTGRSTGENPPLRSRIVVFIAVIQGILFLAHWFLYETWEFFWGVPVASKSSSLPIALAVLSVSFVLASLLAWRSSHVVVRVLYTLSAVWLGTLSFCFLAA